MTGHRLTEEERALICLDWGVREARIRSGFVEIRTVRGGLWQVLGRVEEIVPEVSS